MKTQINTNIKMTWMNYPMIYGGGIPVITRNLSGCFTGVSIPQELKPKPICCVVDAVPVPSPSMAAVLKAAYTSFL